MSAPAFLLSKSVGSSRKGKLGGGRERGREEEEGLSGGYKLRKDPSVSVSTSSPPPSLPPSPPFLPDGHPLRGQALLEHVVFHLHLIVTRHVHGVHVHV